VEVFGDAINADQILLTGSEEVKEGEDGNLEIKKVSN